MQVFYAQEDSGQDSQKCRYVCKISGVSGSRQADEDEGEYGHGKASIKRHIKPDIHIVEKQEFPFPVQPLIMQNGKRLDPYH